MLKFNKKLTALTLLTLTSITGTVVHISTASAQFRDPGKVTPDVVLEDSLDGDGVRSFASDKAVPDLSITGFDNVADRAKVNNNQKWRFYEGKNFQGRSILLEPGQSRSISGLKVSAFRAVPN